jgi:hypothetical protein
MALPSHLAAASHHCLRGAALLAVAGGGALLLEAVIAALLFGFADPTSSPLRPVLLLLAGALLAFGAALALRSSPHSAPLLCLLAALLAAGAQLPFFVERFQRYYEVSFSKRYELTLAQTYAPLLAWIVAAAPLVFAAALALGEAPRSSKTAQ